MGNRPTKSYALKDQETQLPGAKRFVGELSQIGRPASCLTEETFQTMLALERRRAERSRKPFVLMLLDVQALFKHGNSAKLFEQVKIAVRAATRETDIIGWYKQSGILAAIFTEVTLPEKDPITQVLLTKVVRSLHSHVDRQFASKIIITAHLFPENASQASSETTADTKLYPELTRKGRKGISLIAKRAIDIAGSGIFLLVLSPVLAAIALAIKFTSEGPVLFCQERLGQFGATFDCLKFRTMYVNNDPKIHQEYVERFIAGKANDAKSEGEPVVYKITNDPRVTPIGRLLRRLSADELPQFWNVLRGEMSLVGPRPPLPYEFKVYDIWHRRRVLELKPGVTGLWQVSGRSRTSFDDMVRLDLRYSQSWSLWLDLRILVATPRAVFTGDGAY
jgi:lipopolysaccharide/colanic/teichoic acid biosynthesis glycosyltransferase